MLSYVYILHYYPILSLPLSLLLSFSPFLSLTLLLSLPLFPSPPPSLHSLPQSAPHRGSGTSRSSGRSMTHQHAARTLGSSVDPDDLEEIDSGSDDEESATGIGIVEEAASAMHSQVCVQL